MANQAERIKTKILALIEEATNLIEERKLSIEDYKLDGTLGELEEVVASIKKIEIPGDDSDKDGDDSEDDLETKAVKKPTLAEMHASSKKNQAHNLKTKEKDKK